MISPRLSKENIVAIAIEIADEETLSAVTLRGIAARLAVHVTSLYNYVPTKDAVLGEMVRALIAEARLPVGSLPWQAWVSQFATGMRVLAQKHPGAFEAFHYGPAQGERAAETFEAAFAAFRSAGFDATSAYSAVKATIVAVLGFALDDTAGFRSKVARTDLGELPIERFPQLHTMSRVAGKADTFTYLVEVLIAGIEAAPRSASAARKSRARRD